MPGLIRRLLFADQQRWYSQYSAPLRVLQPGGAVPCRPLVRGSGDRQGRSLSCRVMKALGAGGSELDGRRGAGWRGAAHPAPRSLASAWAQRSLPGDSCPLSVPLARPWSLRPPQCFLRPAEPGEEQRLPRGKEQHLQSARQLTSLADRGGLGGTRCFKGIFVQSSCSGLSRSPLGGRFVVYIDSCTISQPLPPPLPA